MNALDEKDIDWESLLILLVFVYLPVTPIWLMLGFVPWLWTVGGMTVFLVLMGWCWGVMIASACVLSKTDISGESYGKGH